jgi:SAM-dependent methyltransferase
MQTQAIQRQYDEIIAQHYDNDPQRILGRSLERAEEQLRAQGFLDRPSAWKVLDVGMGTGSFLSRLLALSDGRVEPFGLDLSAGMVDIARSKIPHLQATVDDAANLDAHFPEHSFDLVCTHFMTGYVPMGVLAPKIHARLQPGGYWSMVGGTMAGWPALQALANQRWIRWLFGSGAGLNHKATNPANCDDVVRTMEQHGFAVCDARTFEPTVDLRTFDEFMEVGYQAGWLTPFIEAAGLHKAGAVQKWLSRFVFPMQDKHNIAIVLGQKTAD